MLHKLLVLVFLFILFGCSRTPLEPQNPENKLLKKNPPEGFIINEAGYEAEIIAEGLTSPEGVGQMGNGILFATDAINGQVIKIEPSGRNIIFAQIPYNSPPSPALVDILIDKNRGIFVNLLRHGKIFRVTFSGQVSEFVSGLNYPSFLALDKEDNIYVSELYSYKITRVDPNGNKTTVIEMNSQNRPRGIVFDNEGRLYVSSAFTGEVRRYDIQNAVTLPLHLNDGILIATIPGISSNYQLQDLTLSLDGDLFAVGNNNIYRVKLTGEVTTFASGLTGLYNTLQVDNKGNLIISDYKNGQEGAGIVIEVSKQKNI